jgi:hypothetical protein
MRTGIAFFVASLVVPLLWILYAASTYPAEGIGQQFPQYLQVVVLVASLGAFYACAGVFIIGAPIYFFLRARKLTAFWIAPVVGFVVGGMVMSAMLGAKAALVVGGPLGALVGTVLWLIGRPDRQTQ